MLIHDEMDENTALRQHTDTGYYKVKIKPQPINLPSTPYKLLLNDYLYELNDSFWFDEEDNDNTGWGSVEFHSSAQLIDFDTNDYVEFHWWLVVSLVGDEFDETKIHLEIDDTYISTDLFNFEVIAENGLTSEDIQDNLYAIGKAIYNIIWKNRKAFDYT